MSYRNPDITPLIQEVIARAGPNASIDDLNRLLGRELQGYNSRPQRELGGLSPDQMSRLLYGDWQTTGALRLAADMSADDVADTPFFADACTLLAYVCDAGPLKETPAKNLTRADVAALLPRLRIFNRALSDQPGAPRGPVNEGDVAWLSVIRHVLLFAKLLVRRRGFRASQLGRECLAPARAGDLYGRLFRTLFRQLDLRAFDMSDRHAGLQSTVAFSFYALREAARDWTSQEELAEVAWLPDAKDPLSESDMRYGDARHYTLGHRVLSPLVQFGLLAVRELPTEKAWLTRREFRLTPLFGRFLRFEFDAAGPFMPGPRSGPFMPGPRSGPFMPGPRF